MTFGKGIAIQKGWVLPVRKTVIAKAFAAFDELSCHLGSLNRSFRFDSRCYVQPKLEGPVAASLSISRTRSAILQCYPVSEINYGLNATEDFEKVVVPHLVSWLHLQRDKPETAVLGHEEIVVTWNGVKHGYVEVRFL
jgi:hypothetical protein